MSVAVQAPQIAIVADMQNKSVQGGVIIYLPAAAGISYNGQLGDELTGMVSETAD